MNEPLYKQIDLSRHAIINASAGTGKTYTIQNLYVRLLLEMGLNPGQILVLTFTEKATAELREKVRGQIGEELKKQPDNETLRAALQGFDAAQIFTIHGFCQRVLSQFALENGEPFRANLADDDWLYEASLRDLLRSAWPRTFGDALPGLLMYAGYPERGAWEAKVVRLAKQIRARPSPADRVLPEAPAVKSILAAQERVRAIFKRLSKAAGVTESAATSRAVAQFERLKWDGVLNRNKSQHTVRSALISAIEQSIAEKGSPDLLNAALACIGREAHIGNIATANKGKEPALAACRELAESAELIRELRDCAAGVTQALTVYAAWGVVEAAEARKRQEGLASFDDLLARLRDALDETLAPNTAKDLARVLRERFRVAIVDEAQDTDRVQWDILRRVFAAEGAVAQRLYAVGDPKQAIYGFRGADVNAYVSACEALGSHAKEYSLGESWRSTRKLVDALNAVFGEGYFDPRSRFAYTSVSAVPDEKRKLSVLEDRAHGGSPLVLYALGDSATGGGKTVARGARGVRARLAHFVAGEIARLLNDGAMTLSVRGVRRGLQPGDICVLVRGKKEAGPVEAALNALKIPHSYYKKAGLYQSREALELSYMLEALARPADGSAFKRALLTSFFRVKLTDLARMGDAPPEHRSRTLLAMWRRWAEERLWARVFRSMQDETGVLLAAPDDADTDAERRQMNFQHLLEELENTARRQHLDLLGLCDYLRRCRFDSSLLEKDADVHRIESERSKVQIMTMHVSKGLEFPVVFVAGGLKTMPKNAVLKYHDKGASVYDLLGAEEAKQRAEQEYDDEEKRLFYVAMTRAQAKCYVPLAEGTSKAPLPRLLGPRLEAVAQLKDPRLASVVQWDFEGPAPPAKKEPAPKTSEWALREDVPLKEILAQKMPGDYARRMRVHKSYSALKHARRTYGEHRVALKDDETGAAGGSSAEALDFPAGADAGTVLHSLFEHIDFKTVLACETSAELAARPEFLKLLEGDDAKALLKGESKYIQAAAGMVWRTLHAEWDGSWDGSGFTLGALEKADRICELEFTFPLPALETSASQDGFLNGFIDLVYRRDIDGVEKYFVLDWKSDALPAYDAASLRRHMEAMEYTLQYKVYALAMARWLKQCGLDPREVFGGIQYVFLRGVGLGTRDGIFVQSVPADLSAWERDIYERLNEPAWAVMEERGR